MASVSLNIGLERSLCDAVKAKPRIHGDPEMLEMSDCGIPSKESCRAGKEPVEGTEVCCSQ